jgi:hypothetical protein
MNKKRLSLSLQTEVIDSDGILHGVITQKRVNVYGNKKKLGWLFNGMEHDLVHTLHSDLEVVSE